MEHSEHKHTAKHNHHENHQNQNHDEHQQNDNGSHNHSGHHALMVQDFRKRFWVSLVVTFPILLLSPMIQGLLGYDFSFTYSGYVLFALSAFVYFYGGWPFLSGLAEELKKKQPGMMTLIAVAITGKGIEAEVENKKVKVVSPGYVKEQNIEIPDKAYKNEQETVVFVLVDNKLAGFIAMADEIREESYEAVKILRKNGMKLYMMTGDNEKVAKSVSDELGLDGYFAGILPDQKLEKVKEFQQQGEFVAMTGDGINDAPALATADVGIAVGSGTDVAAETADIILVNSNPKDIAFFVLFGKETHKKMIQNFIWATGYNVVAIPLAAGVLYNAGILINPALGAVLMSLSTIVVAINAQLLKRKMIVNR